MQRRISGRKGVDGGGGEAKTLAIVMRMLQARGCTVCGFGKIRLWQTLNHTLSAGRAKWR